MVEWYLIFSAPNEKSEFLTLKTQNTQKNFFFIMVSNIFLSELWGEQNQFFLIELRRLKNIKMVSRD